MALFYCQIWFTSTQFNEAIQYAAQLQTGFYLCGKSSHFLHWTKTKKGVQVVFLDL